jgi:hypothetical protein
MFYQNLYHRKLFLGDLVSQVKQDPTGIISCDISSGRTYFTGKLYYISSTDVKFVPVNYLAK